MINDILQATQALLNGHFLLTSGRHSEYYVEKIRIINNPVYVEKLCQLLSTLLKYYDCDLVLGPAYGGIVLAYELARIMGKRFAFTQRKDEKMIIRPGFQVKPQQKVIIIEDIVTTGGSVQEVIALLEELQVSIQAIGCIVDRSGGKATFNYPFISLHEMKIETWSPEECPLCQTGIPLVKPGASDKKNTMIQPSPVGDGHDRPA